MGKRHVTSRLAKERMNPRISMNAEFPVPGLEKPNHIHSLTSEFSGSSITLNFP